MSVNLAALESIGKEAFLYCIMLEEVTLGNSITELSESAFRECPALHTVDLGGVTKIGNQAFAYTALKSIDLSKVTEIGNYAFTYCESLGEASTVIFNPAGTEIGEGAFAYTSSLTAVENLDKVTKFGPYSFAYSAVTDLDLSSAVEIGDSAFMKEAMTPVTLVLGECLEVIGDNPFAYCAATPFSTVIEESFGDQIYTSVSYDFDLSENVVIIDGSIYARVPYGLELITYIPNGNRVCTVDEDTVRITAYAFAGSDVVMVTLPHALNSIGHKAFYDCMSLTTVVFKSYDAPVLEEEFDMEYYQSYENLPSTGDYYFNDYEGNLITIHGLEILPFNMIEPYIYYSNAYYGANFVGNIGHYTPSLVMIAPSNGNYYDTFIMSQYFEMGVEGAVAADDITVSAIEAILAMPTPVQLKDEALVVAARAAYNRIVSTEQRALVDEYYGLLQSAEIRIEALKGIGSTPEEPPVTPEEPKESNAGFIVLLVFVIIESVIIVGAIAFVVVYFLVMKKGRFSVLGFNLTFGKKEAVEDDSADEAGESTDEQEAPKGDDAND